jgi:hypothetical protein
MKFTPQKLILCVVCVCVCVYVYVCVCVWEFMFSYVINYERLWFTEICGRDFSCLEKAVPETKLVLSKIPCTGHATNMYSLFGSVRVIEGLCNCVSTAV